MATVDINGTLIDFPDNLTPEQLQQAVASAAQQVGGQPAPSQGGVMGWLDKNSMPIPQDAGTLNRKTKYLTIPQKLAQEGLSQLADMVPNPEPTGKEGMISKAARMVIPELTMIPKGTLGDLARGAPKVVTETLKEEAPGFVSRGSILTLGATKAAGALARPAKALLRGIGKQGESLSGSVPGSLEAAYKDSSLMFGKGRKAASAAYEAAKAKLPGFQTGGKLKTNARLFNEALKKAEEGTLHPIEALEARKAADALYESKQYAKEPIRQGRKGFDEAVKSVKELGEADKQFKRGIMSESLRNVFPQNKYGGASAFKVGIMTALHALGIPGKAASALLSPIVQGTAATGTGVAARQVIAPLLKGTNAVGLSGVLQERRKKGANNGR